jgi:membrane protein involved in colicin uptake
MMAVADAALYSAKRAGRNCIMVDGEAAAALDDFADDQWTGVNPPKAGGGGASEGQPNQGDRRPRQIEGEPLRPLGARTLRPRSSPPV